VDFVVVPVGPVALAEFEQAAPPPAAPAKPGADPSSPPAGQGSGVRVKEADPSEVPPNAVYLKSGDALYQIPCFQNAVGTPVRVPVTDTELVFQTRSAGEEFTSLEKCQLPENAGCVLVLLTKPLAEKKWTRPTVTAIGIPRHAGPQILVANASSAATCGAVINQDTKILLPPLKRHVWRPAATHATPRAAVALAMQHDGRFLPSLHDDHLTLAKGATSILIAYEVTAQESFRRGKYAMGTVREGESLPAEIHGKKQP
jgi:hypothetical protein